MTNPDEVVFLLDVDNTLLNNDRVQADLKTHLEHEFGKDSSDQYWSIFDRLRAELGYADYLGALQRYRLGEHDPAPLQALHQPVQRHLQREQIGGTPSARRYSYWL